MSSTDRTAAVVLARGALALLGCILAVSAWNAMFELNFGPLQGFFAKWSYNVVLVGASLLCVVRGLGGGRDRRVWLLLGTSMLMWSLGNVYYSVVLWDKETIPVPSPSDAFWIAFYPGAYLSLLQLLRHRRVDAGGGLWLDGAIGAFAIASAAVAFLFDRILTTSGASPLSVATNLAYPVGDTVLLMLTVAAIAINGWRLHARWLLLALGFVGFGLIDSVYLVGVASGTWSPGNVGEAGWPLAMLLMASASWEATPRRGSASLGGMRLLLAPALFAAVALGVLVYDHFDRVHGLALGLSTGAIALVIARMALTFRDNMRQLSERAEQALSDALTGLGNRRKLLADIPGISRERGASLLVLFDLNGFKDYNDRFGHPAGDALLARVGERLAAAVNGEGHAYRLGGDEFCTLTSHTRDEAESAAARLAAAFSEQGDGFSIGASYGWATVEESTAPSEVLRLADRRMYADKHRGRATAARQSADVLAKALRERNLELSDHLGRVAQLSRGVAERIGLSDKEIEEIVHAAELHDVGKVAIPDEILLKPGSLTTGERAFIEQHTIMGERILSAAPSLARVGRLVRHSHERFDGEGYPDRLRGEEIPLGARVIHVCDAFEAMTSDRPYKRAMTSEAALAELARCSNTQFDARVVDTFSSMVEQGAAVAEDAHRGEGDSANGELHDVLPAFDRSVAHR
jgi:two-component system cell cycle response regulator